MEHQMKIQLTPFNDLKSGRKTCEVRNFADREFREGDTVRLNLIDETSNPTGISIVRTITHIQYGFGLPDDVCVLSYAPAEDVRAVGEEPVRLTAVATLRDDGDGGLEADWLLEGGTSELFEGMILLVADNDPTLCEEDGSAEVYRHPSRPVVMAQERARRTTDIRDEAYDNGWNACIDEFKRLNK